MSTVCKAPSTEACVATVEHVTEVDAGSVISPPSGQQAGAGLACLLDEQWLAVLRMVTMKDRYHLSQTCRKLYALFNLPSVWRSAELDLPADSGSDPAHPSRSRALMLPWQKAMVAKFGHYFHKVTVGLGAFDIHPDCFQMLLSMAKAGSMKTCVVRVTGDHCVAVFQAMGENSGNANMHRLLMEFSSLLTPANLHVDFENSMVTSGLYSDIISCSSSDVRCNCLRSFKVPFADYTEQQLVDQLSVQAETGEIQTPTAIVISRFPALQHLYLSDYNLSDQLLYELANSTRRRHQVRTLAVDFTACDNEEADEVHEVSSHAWSQLALSCPQLQVTCYFCRPDNLDRTLKPETPLTSISIENAGEQLISATWFQRFCLDHSCTLQSLKYDVASFVDFDEDLRPEEIPLVPIATACPKLLSLQYCGVIRVTDLISLADMGRQWTRLAISDRYVMRDTQTADENLTMEQEAEMLEEARAAVSHCLGFRWDFFSPDTDEDD